MRTYTKITTVVAPILLGLTLTACGQPTYKDVNTDGTMGAVSYIQNFEDESIDSDFLNKSVIEVQRDMSLTARTELNEDSKSFSLKDGDSFTVLKKEKDVNGKEFVQIYLEDENQSDDVQHVVWIPVEELSSSSLEMVEMEDPFDEFGNEIVESDNEEESSTLMTAAKKSKKSNTKKKGKKKMTYCYRFVKIRLQKLGLVKGYLPGGSAYQAATILPKYGFKRTSRGVKGARKNDVCVYSGGNGGNGHIEIRTAGGWWYGYGAKLQPISLNGRRLIACFSKG